ncbi:hypothetical protein [uncultured Roseobacter sp.]|uniref:hypothetical protein n=1 Tax=uncultured Roseobacter sp. TaxID=114847 RepID=UPI00261C7AA0|nr:hypothetical protein [uncultured Roseobacter sp.]
MKYPRAGRPWRTSGEFLTTDVANVPSFCGKVWQRPGGLGKADTAGLSCSAILARAKFFYFCFCHVGVFTFGGQKSALNLCGLTSDSPRGNRVYSATDAGGLLHRYPTFHGLTGV